MKIFPLFLLLLVTGCQQFPQLPAGVVGVNLTYTIAPAPVAVATPKDTPKPEPLLEPTAAPAPASVVMPAP